MLNTSPTRCAGGVVGHVLDQPEDVERVADHAGSTDQFALAAAELGEFVQPRVGLRHAEATEQQVERSISTGQVGPGKGLQ